MNNVLYRSLHLVIKTPVYLSDRKEMVNVEVQIRTIAMDFWASLEHELKNKTDTEVSDTKNKCSRLWEQADCGTRRNPLNAARFHSPYRYLPGGRVKMGETAEEAVIREIREELFATPEIVRPLWLNQAFFTEENTFCIMQDTYYYPRFIRIFRAACRLRYYSYSVRSVKFSGSSNKYRVYIIDEVHMLSLQAFNALLKTLEEPPEHVKFILATTVLCRCHFRKREQVPRIGNTSAASHQFRGHMRVCRDTSVQH